MTGVLGSPATGAFFDLRFPKAFLTTTAFQIHSFHFPKVVQIAQDRSHHRCHVNVIMTPSIRSCGGGQTFRQRAAIGLARFDEKAACHSRCSQSSRIIVRIAI